MNTTQNRTEETTIGYGGRVSPAERVAKARELADAGAHEEAAALLYELAIADLVGDIGYAERMRWHETAGALARGGFDLRADFIARIGAPPRRVVFLLRVRGT